MISDRILALCELSNDLFYHKIPPEKRSLYVDASLAAGEKAALDWAGREIQDIYRAQGISIAYTDSPKNTFGVLLRGQAELSREGCSVTVCRDSIRELARHSAFEGLPALDEEAALRVHLAHEFFHYLEFRDGSPVGERLESVETARLWKLSRRAHIGRCGEIAAHAFAKALAGISVLPNFYDYLYLIGTGKMSREQFRELLESMERMLGAGPPSPE